MTVAQKVLRNILKKHAKPYPPIIERMDAWPIHKLSEDRKQFIAEIDDFTLERIVKLNPKLYDLLAQTIYQERNRIKEMPWKVDPPNDASFWNKIRIGLLKSDGLTKQEALDNQKSLLRRIIHRYSEEIVGTFSIPTFRFAQRFLTAFFNRLLNAALERWWRIFGSRHHVYERFKVFGEIETVRSLYDYGTVVIVPTHFSNIDSILVGYVLDQIVGLPSSSYGAGLNLYNSGVPAFFMNRLGAYRVDRRKKNEIYLETLKAMSKLSIQRGTNTLFFPGGTRSRSGEVETKLKMGLLGTAVEAQRAMCQDKSTKKVFIVPLVMSYHFTLEAPFLIQQHLQIVGKERYLKGKVPGTRLRDWIRFIYQLFSLKSDIYLSLGKPMDVMGNFVDKQGQSFDQHGNILDIKEYFNSLQKDAIEAGGINDDLQREGEYTKLLADKVVDRFHRENIVLSSHVVAFAAFNILKAHNDSLDLYALLRLPSDDYVFPMEELTKAVTALQNALFELESKDRLKLSDAIRLPAHELTLDGVNNLGLFHVRKPLTINKKGDIESDDFATLFYYSNRLENFGLSKRVRWEQFKMEMR
jgi:glycerol-3-phosphate O-acyltransferase